MHGTASIKFNRNHPELRDNEQFYQNVSGEFIAKYENLPDYRVGENSYDVNGMFYKNGRPVFEILKEKRGDWA